MCLLSRSLYSSLRFGVTLSQCLQTILAFLPEEIRDNLMGQGELEAHSKFTITNKSTLRCEFKHIYNEYQSEVAVLLWHNFTKHEWKVEVPEQTVSGGSVHYTREEENVAKFEKAGFICVGSIHSHCEMGAFHSGAEKCEFWENTERIAGGIRVPLSLADRLILE